jgi:pimeloyl-ACP methyl ester carboxylesterase
VRRALLVILPGNPGVASLYGELVRALERQGHEVLVSSHPALPDGSDLLCYARHHAEATLRHLHATGRAPSAVEIVLIGHSVGAYLTTLIVTRGLLPVSRVILLFPFLARPRLTGRLILGAVTARRLFIATILSLRLLPVRWRRGLVRAAGAGELTAPILELLSSAVPFAAAAMARAERAEIASRADAAYLFEHPLLADPSRTAVLLCGGDRWVSATVTAQLGSLARPVDQRVRHALVVDGEQCRLLASALDPLLPRQPGAGPLVPGG